MNLTEYIRILARRGWIMLLLAVLVGGAAYLVSREQTPVYRATQKVVIQPSRADLGLAEASIRLLNSLVVIMDSELIAAEIIEELQLDMLPGQLKNDVTIAPDQLRLVIQIDVDSTDPGVASRVARAWGDKLKAYREELNQQVRSEDRIEAVLPDLPSVGQQEPRPRLVGVAGGIMGLLVGGIVVFVLEYVESAVIRRREDLSLPVLAAIPHID